VTTSRERPRVRRAAAASPFASGIALCAAAAVLALAACGGSKSGRSDYVQDADTGAAAPATTPTLNAPGTPDSTAGVSERTGNRAPAGDTLGSKGAATGATNPTASGRTPPATQSAPATKRP